MRDQHLALVGRAPDERREKVLAMPHHEDDRQVGVRVRVELLVGNDGTVGPEDEAEVLGPNQRDRLLSPALTPDTPRPQNRHAVDPVALSVPRTLDSPSSSGRPESSHPHAFRRYDVATIVPPAVGGCLLSATPSRKTLSAAIHRDGFCCSTIAVGAFLACGGIPLRPRGAMPRLNRALGKGRSLEQGINHDQDHRARHGSDFCHAERCVRR